MDDYKEFTNKILKRGSKQHKISHCVGAKEAWKNARKNKYKLLKGNPCSYSDYAAVIRAVNKYLAEKLLEGNSVNFPYQMGSLKLSSKDSGVKAKDGVVKDNYYVNWKATLDYWYENPEAMRDKTRIKRIRKQKYFIRYYKMPTSKNHNFYRFRANRSLVKNMGRVAEYKQ